jgi:hypothetical protein
MPVGGTGTDAGRARSFTHAESAGAICPDTPQGVVDQGLPEVPMMIFAPIIFTAPHVITVYINARPA